MNFIIKFTFSTHRNQSTTYIVNQAQQFYPSLIMLKIFCLLRFETFHEMNSLQSAIGICCWRQKAAKGFQYAEILVKQAIKNTDRS